MAEKADSKDVPDGQASVHIPPIVPPIVNIPTIDKRWISQDLQLLRSGLFADAEIICLDDGTPRKVHRNVLAGRSAWFKKAFFGDFKEAKECKVNLQEMPWCVDLMLYFFYTGGIDLKDEALTRGHDVMDIGVELLRLGDSFQSRDMGVHAAKMLSKYLGGILQETCRIDLGVDSQVRESLFKKKNGFPQQFCNAVVNAFNKERPAKRAQDILADFAIAARMHLFENKEFVSFITDRVVPEFGNLVLTALLNGSVSGVFNNLDVFQLWQDWRVVPPRIPPPQTAVPGCSPRVTGGGDTAAPLEAPSSGRGKARSSFGGRVASNSSKATPK